MVSEAACLEIIRTMYGRTAAMTRHFFPDDPGGGSKETSTEQHAMSEADLYRHLLPRYDIQVLDQAIRWLQVSGYLSKTQWGLGGPWVHVLTEKAQEVAAADRFSPEDRALLYQEDPHGVFIAQQFNVDDQDLVRYLREDVLEPAGFHCYEGKAEALEPFRTAILSKIRRARFFICVLTKRTAVQTGGYVSSVWLYQETGAAMAYGKSPLLLVEEGIDPQYVGELQKVYEYITFTRSNHARTFRVVLPRLLADLDLHGVIRPTPRS
jgi:hypothetical protein